MCKIAKKTKKQMRVEKWETKRDQEEKRIVEILTDSGEYSHALNPLIETYLDAYQIYGVKYEEWKDAGFPTTKRHTNKAGATNETKHPLAQMVGEWSLKKSKYLGQLGLDAKNTKRINKVGPLVSETETVKTEEVKDELAEHRVKWGRKV
ncbi:P27 family phage terminase small subunit [Listeria booriae]|uniref:P27 family phage terminase small subunit n=1 Tax=Listeria booriae TaxID=1552123 RepID=UPI00289A9FF8|nr:P27 family phage terminase small subunit [Listeria booriae]